MSMRSLAATAMLSIAWLDAAGAAAADLKQILPEPGGQKWPRSGNHRSRAFSAFPAARARKPRHF